MAQTNLAELRGPKNDPAVRAGFDTLGGFELIQRTAKLFASSNIVPTSFQGNIANCVIAVDMALRMGANPLMVCQHLYVIHGRPAWSAQFMIATFNQNGKYSALRYYFEGKPGTDEWGCRAWTVEKDTKEKLEGPLITIGLAKKEGWYNKNGSKWQSMPELMLRYRAAAWLIRTYAPEIAMGLQSVEEVIDTFDMEQASIGTYTVTSSEILSQKQAVEEEPVFDVAPEEPSPAPDSEPSPRSSFVITCPKNGQQVDEIDCSGKPCRNGCPEFE